ncbi:MAG TPA: DedA family protein [Acidimicrobiales bacterium]|nr:DedA family protein [Acidimicrobiales bacterium]
MSILSVMSLAVVRLVAQSSDQQLPGGLVGRLLHFHGPAAYALVGFLVFAEAALLVGFFIPGETAAVVGGVLAGLHQVNLELMIVVVVVCAIVGDSVGFEVGKRAGPRLLNHRPMKGNLGVKKSMQLLERYGGPAVFLGRFVAFARAVIPGLAGFSGLRYRTFFLYNAAGGIVWGVGYTLLGYVVGLSFERILRQVGLWSVAVVGGLIVIAVVVRILLKRREKRKLTSEFGPEGDTGSTPEVDTGSTPQADTTTS